MLFYMYRYITYNKQTACTDFGFSNPLQGEGVEGGRKRSREGEEKERKETKGRRKKRGVGENFELREVA